MAVHEADAGDLRIFERNASGGCSRTTTINVGYTWRTRYEIREIRYKMESTSMAGIGRNQG